MLVPSKAHPCTISCGAECDQYLTSFPVYPCLPECSSCNEEADVPSGDEMTAFDHCDVINYVRKSHIRLREYGTTRVSVRSTLGL